MEEVEKKSQVESWIILIALALVWGSSFILMKRGLESFTAFQVGGLRMVLALFCLLPFTINKFKKIPASKWPWVIAIGFLGNGIPSFLFCYAETGIDSSLAGILNVLTPVFTLIVSVVLFRMKTTVLNVLGILIGFVGAFILMRSGGNGTVNFNSFALYVVAATVCYAFSVNIIRHKLSDIDHVLLSGAALLVAGIPSLIYILFTDFFHRLSSSTMAFSSMSYVLILALFGTAISLVYFNKLIKLSGALFASSTTYFIPVVAVLWGLLDHEQFNLNQLIGLLIILSGVYLVNKKKSPVLISKNL